MFSVDLHCDVCDVIYVCAVSTGNLARLFVFLRLAALWNRNHTVSKKSAAKQRYEIGPWLWSKSVLRKSSLFTAQKKSFRCWRKYPREIFQGKPTQSSRDWKPNPCSAPGVILTGFQVGEGKDRCHYANATNPADFTCDTPFLVMRCRVRYIGHCAIIISELLLLLLLLIWFQGDWNFTL